jgi:hypothetical protein
VFDLDRNRHIALPDTFDDNIHRAYSAPLEI